MWPFLGFEGFFASQARVSRRGRNPGGVAIFIADRIKHWVKGSKSLDESRNIIWAKLKSDESQLFWIGSVYNQPSGSRHRDANFYDNIRDFLESFSADNEEANIILLLGTSMEE